MNMNSNEMSYKEEKQFRQIVRGVLVHMLDNNGYSREDMDALLYALDNSWELTPAEAVKIHFQILEGTYDFTKAELRGNRIGDKCKLEATE